MLLKPIRQALFVYNMNDVVKKGNEENTKRLEVTEERAKILSVLNKPKKLDCNLSQQEIQSFWWPKEG